MQNVDLAIATILGRRCCSGLGDPPPAMTRSGYEPKVGTITTGGISADKLNRGTPPSSAPYTTRTSTNMSSSERGELVGGIFSGLTEAVAGITSAIVQARQGSQPGIEPLPEANIDITGMSATTPWGRIAIGGSLVFILIGGAAYYLGKKKQ